MKKYALIIVVILFTGCTIGNGHICGPQTPTAYCNKEAYEKLMHPKPYGAHWIKEGMARESRRVDYMQCGGGSDLREGYGVKSVQSNKEFFDGFNVHTHQLMNCMKSKGYVYLDQCDSRCLHP